jgi:acetyl esterase/lipase
MHALLLALASLAPLADDLKPTKEELLWPKGAPGALGETAKDKPKLDIYLPPKSKRTPTAVLVCPGGGYGALALDHEGKQIAAWLNARGVPAFVLHYRLGPRYRHPVPLQDAQRALRLIRSRAREYGIDSDRIGVWGFSAGGHLASTLSTKYDAGKKDAGDPIDRVGCRPDFSILCYPVIRMDSPHGHAGSRRNLLGDKPDDKLVASLCNDTQVTKDTPPTFLLHTKPDKVVVLANSELYFKALQKHDVPCKLVILDRGAHGIGLGGKDRELSAWPKKLEAWLIERKLLPATAKE